MKLTIDIPTERTAEVLRFLAALMPAHQEPQADPAPGHPELPLPDMPDDVWKQFSHLDESGMAGKPVRFESTHDGGRSNRFMKDFMKPDNNQLHNFCEMDATFAAIQAGKTQTVQEWAERKMRENTGMPIPRRVTTECHKCGGGTGQEDPCVCAARHAATIAAADPLKVAMDDPVEAEPEDPTMREFPWGELPEPPPLPEGKIRWVNRGRFRGVEFDTGDRTVYWLNNNERWLETIEFSMDYTHIEAI
jgi:hypothetical protein